MAASTCCTTTWAWAPPTVTPRAARSGAVAPDHGGQPGWGDGAVQARAAAPAKRSRPGRSPTSARLPPSPHATRQLQAVEGGPQRAHRWLAFENAPHNLMPGANLLMLGFIDTPLAIEGYHRFTGTPRDDIRAARHQAVPMGRMGTAWEVAAAAVFLASDESSYLTGAILPIDGGMHTRVGA
ncbi:MAG: SDR family oxidoreductase [Acidimicrobiales bacterium]